MITNKLTKFLSTGVCLQHHYNQDDVWGGDRKFKVSKQTYQNNLFLLFLIPLSFFILLSYFFLE